MREFLQILRGLNHDNIVLMLDYFDTDREICVVTEFAQVHVVAVSTTERDLCALTLVSVVGQGELFHILEDDQQLPEEEVQQISKQLVQVRFFLHLPALQHWCVALRA